MFEALGCLPGTHPIKVDVRVTLVVHPPGRVPIVLKSNMKVELDRMGARVNKSSTKSLHHG